MYAIITDGSISKYVSHPKPLVIGDVQYPARIFSAWTASELAAIGIIEVTFDDSNKKDIKWYVNGKQTYTYDASAGTVTATYGTATAKPVEELKTTLIITVKAQAEGLLNKTDWYITRKAEKNTAIPSNITTWRDGIRTKQAAMETSITNASNTPALETLYTYTRQEDGSVTRPLGEFPELGS